MLLVVITMIVTIVLCALIEWVVVIGLSGVITGERMERCSRCHHFGLTAGGKLHA